MGFRKIRGMMIDGDPAHKNEIFLYFFPWLLGVRGSVEMRKDNRFGGGEVLEN